MLDEATESSEKHERKGMPSLRMLEWTEKKTSMLGGTEKRGLTDDEEHHLPKFGSGM